jgi:hypothetical protein
MHEQKLAAGVRSVMKAAKGSLLGSAAVMISSGGGNAADLPKHAPPIQYVSICTLYGDGYYYVPGSDTCIKLGGYIAADMGWNVAGARTPAYSGTQGAQDRTVSQMSTRFRVSIAMDIRTQTQYGTLRTLTSLYWQNENQTESFNVARALLQWAGFTFGRAESFSDTWSIVEPWNLETPQAASDTSANGVNTAAYTFDLSNGLTLTVGADERRTRALTNLSVNSVLKVGSEATDFHAGEQYPDPFLSLRTDQTWGYAVLSGGIHDVNATSYTQSGTAASLATSGVPGYSCTAAGFAGGVGATNTPLATCGHPSDKVGFFLMAGGEAKLPQLGPGDRVGASLRYSQGATGYGAGLNLASADQFGSGNSLALGWDTDGVYVNGSSIELTTAWGVSTGYAHFFTTTFNADVFASYSVVTYDGTARTYFSDAIGCTAGPSGAVKQAALAVATGGSCSPDYQFLETGIRATWSPVPGFYFAAEGLYTYVWTGFGGDTVNLAGTNPILGARPAGLYSIGNESSVSAIFRVRRGFNLD